MAYHIAHLDHAAVEVARCGCGTRPRHMRTQRRARRVRDVGMGVWCATAGIGLLTLTVEVLAIIECLVIVTVVITSSGRYADAGRAILLLVEVHDPFDCRLVRKHRIVRQRLALLVAMTHRHILAEGRELDQICAVRHPATVTSVTSGVGIAARPLHNGSIVSGQAASQLPKPQGARRVRKASGARLVTMQRAIRIRPGVVPRPLP